MTGSIPLVHGSDGELNDALAAAAGVPRSLHEGCIPSMYYGDPDSPGHRPWGDIPCSLPCPVCGETPCPGPRYCPPAYDATPQPEGNPAMNQNADQKQPVLQARVNELENIIAEVRGDLGSLEDAVDRLLGFEPQSEQKAEGQAGAGSFDGSLQLRIDELRALSGRMRHLNERLSEAV